MQIVFKYDYLSRKVWLTWLFYIISHFLCVFSYILCENLPDISSVASATSLPRLPLFGGVGVYFCIMMELEELIREYEEGIALEMYHEMVDYIDNHGADITGRNVDYTLMEVISTVRESAYMPEETMLALRGYEIVVETYMGLGISFCMGQFWIGGKLIQIRYEEEIENYLVHFINNILPGGLAVWKEKMEHVDMDLLKREKSVTFWRTVPSP